MRKSEIEAWALDIIDRVVKGQPTEDDRIELKAEWIDAKKAARQIAGHANASHGEPALWLIGVDEAGKVPGVELDKFADWHQAVLACFDELAPEIERLNVPYEGVTVSALLIETDRAPFVVKCQEGGGVAREVPYRRGTRCDAVTRSQLIRILNPIATTPKLEPFYANLTMVWQSMQGLKTKSLVLTFKMTFLLVQDQNQESVLLARRTKAGARFTGGEKFVFRSATYTLEDELHSHSGQTLALRGPTTASVETKLLENSETEPRWPLADSQAIVDLSVVVPNCGQSTDISITLNPVGKHDGHHRQWHYSGEG